MYVCPFSQVSEVHKPFLLTKHVYLKKGVNIHGRRHEYQFGLYKTGPFVPLPGDDPEIQEKYGRYMCNAIIIIYAPT